MSSIAPLLKYCSRPPKGWRCRRHSGHQGPCDLVPYDACLELGPVFLPIIVLVLVFIMLSYRAIIFDIFGR